MPISFTCPHCGNSTQVAEQYAGQTGPCSKCGRPITIPGVAMSASVDGAAAAIRTGVPILLIVAIVGVLSLIGLAVVGALIFPAIANAREHARQTVCLSNMRQTGMAMILFESSKPQGTFPPSRDALGPGLPPVSWRTRVLPFVEQQTLFNRYVKDKPWNDPSNQDIQVTIELYRCPSDATNEPSPAPISNLVVVNGEQCIFNGATSIGTSALVRGDGVTNTILLGETFRIKIKWPEPRDLEFDEVVKSYGTPAASFDSQHPRGVNVIFADGHGRIVGRETDREVLQALLTYNGKDLVTDDLQRIK